MKSSEMVTPFWSIPYLQRTPPKDCGSILKVVPRVGSRYGPAQALTTCIFTQHIQFTLPEWTAVLLNNLVLQLNNLPFNHIVECIRQLPVIDRPSVNSRSHQKTISGLVNHILEHVRYLTSIPVLIMCDIMEYCLPYESLLEYWDVSESECIEHILGIEYGEDIMLAFTRPKCSYLLRLTQVGATIALLDHSSRGEVKVRQTLVKVSGYIVMKLGGSDDKEVIKSD